MERVCPRGRWRHRRCLCFGQRGQCGLFRWSLPACVQLLASALRSVLVLCCGSRGGAAAVLVRVAAGVVLLGVWVFC